MRSTLELRPEAIERGLRHLSNYVDRLLQSIRTELGTSNCDRKKVEQLTKERDSVYRVGLELLTLLDREDEAEILFGPYAIPVDEEVAANRKLATDIERQLDHFAAGVQDMLEAPKAPCKRSGLMQMVRDIEIVSADWNRTRKGDRFFDAPSDSTVTEAHRLLSMLRDDTSDNATQIEVHPTKSEILVVGSLRGLETELNRLLKALEDFRPDLFEGDEQEAA